MPRSTNPFVFGVVISLFAAIATGQPPDPTRTQRQPPPPVPAGETRPGHREELEASEPLVHGPVHEAFAAPTPRQPLPPQKVSQLPPQLPEELAPQVAPQQDGEPARWIPGYWGWDARDQGYIWISGTWRSAPPEMEWVPGYWSSEGGECRWVAGFWAHGGEEELAYLPAPPAPEVERPDSATDENHFWICGNWQYVDDEYRWKPGFWAAVREGWIWTPDCYMWTPRGHVFVRGYWDLPLERRGTLFAPLAIQDAVRLVSPTVVIDVREALAHWFVAPTYQHYCFGDYYEAGLRGSGEIVSWYEDQSAGHEYDAVRSYYSNHEAKFFGSLVSKHAQCQQTASHRPALDWGDYNVSESEGLAFAIPDGRLPVGFSRVDFADEEFSAIAAHYRSVVDRRTQFEQAAISSEGREAMFIPLDSFVSPGHGGLPPGLAKKGLVPPGFGGAPPGQVKKVIESFGPIYEKSPKGKGKPGKKGGGKGKGK